MKKHLNIGSLLQNSFDDENKSIFKTSFKVIQKDSEVPRPFFLI